MTSAPLRANKSFDLTGGFFKRQEELEAALGIADITDHPALRVTIPN
jgi:hypothetical protein